MTTDVNPLLEILDDTLKRGRGEESTDVFDSEVDRVIELRPLGRSEGRDLVRP